MKLSNFSLNLSLNLVMISSRVCGCPSDVISETTEYDGGSCVYSEIVYSFCVCERLMAPGTPPLEGSAAGRKLPVMILLGIRIWLSLRYGISDFWWSMERALA